MYYNKLCVYATHRKQQLSDRARKRGRILRRCSVNRNDCYSIQLLRCMIKEHKNIKFKNVLQDNCFRWELIGK